MKHTFYISPIGQPKFSWESTHQKSDKWFKGLLCFMGLFFLGHMVVAIGSGAI